MNEHAPGWYEHDGERRYWDGTQWTHSTSLPGAASSPGQPVSPPGSPSRPPAGGAVAWYAPPPHQGHPPNAAYGAPPPVVVPPARKEPAISLLVSFFIPGVGSMINGEVGAGVAFLLVYLLGGLIFVCLGWVVVGFIGVPISLGAWIWSMVHAYQGAVTHNRALGYPT